MNKTGLIGFIGSIFLGASMAGCLPSNYYQGYSNPRYYQFPQRTRVINHCPGYRGSSYGVTRDSRGRVIRRSGAVWNNGSPRRSVGLPRNLNPQNIKEKFRRDVRRLRRGR